MLMDRLGGHRIFYATKELDIKDFNSVAHLPISYLGLIFRSEKTDGRYMSPIEFFEHDLSHASIISVFRHDRDKSYNMFMQLNEKIKNQDPAVTNILQRIENAPTQSIVNSGRLLFFRHAHEFGQQDFSTEAFKKLLSRGNLSTLYSLLKRGFYGAPENLGINSFKDLQAAAKLITEP